jgi:hypothetical protein
MAAVGARRCPLRGTPAGSEGFRGGHETPCQAPTAYRFPLSFLPSTLPQGADPIDVLTSAPPLQRMRPIFGDGRDYPLPHSLGRRGYSVDPEQGTQEHLIYVVIAGCAGGGSQMVIMDTTSDTEKQVDGEFRGCSVVTGREWARPRSDARRWVPRAKRLRSARRAFSSGALRDQSGAEGDRTPDLLHAMQALSQLSYSPGADGNGRKLRSPCLY